MCSPDRLIDLPDSADPARLLTGDAGPEDRSVRTYLDTAEDDLRRAGVELRRDQRADASGWMLRLPDGSTLEHADSATVPAGLAAIVRGVRRGGRLLPVARLTVSARAYPQRDGAEVVLETVSAAVAGSSAGAQQWHRVRITGDGAKRVARAFTQRKVGGRRARGDLDRLRPLAEPTRAGRDPRAGDLIADYLRTEITAILHGDLQLRRDLGPGGELIHRTRVATRRLRSTLRVFAEYVEPGRAAALDTELGWYAAALGEVRDREVMQDHLRTALAELPATDVLGPVATRIDTTLAGEHAAARQRLDRVLRGARYRALLDELAGWRIAAPLTLLADEPGGRLRRPVDRAARTLRKKLARAERAARTPHADETLHAARKAAKRLRYAVELAGPALGARQRRDGPRAKRMQTVLGEHQDAVVAAELLRRLAAGTARRRDENGFTFGLLYAAELRRAECARRAAGRAASRHS